jgi:SsrA-binding protein
MPAPTPTIDNRKARHNYMVLEKYETGIVLSGTEVKSIRKGNITLGESWVEVTDQNELFLNNAYIEEFTEGNRNNHKPLRQRKLLAHKSEILKMKKARDLQGLTLIPLKMYFHKQYAKLEVGICKGKDKHDKRQDVIQRESKREISRAIKLSVR